MSDLEKMSSEELACEIFDDLEAEGWEFEQLSLTGWEKTESYKELMRRLAVYDEHCSGQISPPTHNDCMLESRPRDYCEYCRRGSPDWTYNVAYCNVHHKFDCKGE